MSKQTAVEWLVEQFEQKGGAWENASIRRIQVSIDVTEYLELKRLAKAMEREQIEHAYVEGGNWDELPKPRFDNYYEQTYGKEASNE